MLDEIEEKKEPPGRKPFRAGSSVDISIPHILPNTEKNRSLYENGISHLMPRLKLKVYSDWETCYDLWEQFTPKRSVFHSWNYRYGWGKSFDLIPYFYTIYDRKTPLAVLPLSYNQKIHKYAWFGSAESWMEDNEFFVKDDKLINILLKVIPEPALLSGIQNIPYEALYENIFVEDDAKYIKDISNFNNIDEYLAQLSKKHRYNLKKDIEFIEGYNPRIEVADGKNYGELEELITLAVNRFTAKDDTNNFLEDEMMRAFRNAIEFSGDDYKVRFLKVYIQNRLVASDFILLYKDIYTIPRGGADSNRFPGLGNYMCYLNIKNALESGYKTVDCLQTDDGGYKHRLFDPKKMMKVEV